MKKKRRIMIALILPGILLIYFLSCLGFYLFEPVTYHAPDLSGVTYSFDLYKNYTYEQNSSFYIRTLTDQNVRACPDDERLKYVDDTVLIIADAAMSYSQISSVASDYGATVTGYIEDADLYQFTFSGLSYSDILDKCSVLEQCGYVEAALPDYFEETPSADIETDVQSVTDTYYYSMIHAPVDASNRCLSIVNSDDYSDICLNDSSFVYPTHGTHVAGIIGATRQSDTPGICPNARIYSYNGANASLSYWLAAISDMITQRNVRVINISMGYNDYIPIGASLGCESTIRFIQSENDFMEIFLTHLIDNGFDFLICIAAGNDSGSSLYKVNSPVFGYGEKSILYKLDKLSLFDDKPEYCDAAYALFMTGIENEDVRDHIMVVGSCNAFTYSSFSDAGQTVDIAAPGENIYSTIPGNEYAYGSGTSMATPFVSGTAALLFSLDSSLTAKEVKEIMISSSSETVSAYGFTYPVLNAGAAAKYVTENKQ